MRAKRILIAAGVLVCGLIAAWPFHQPRPPTARAAPTAAAPELCLRKSDVSLSVGPPSDQSPAVGPEGNARHAPLVDNQSIQVPVTETSLRLENLSPPPRLPIAFHDSQPDEVENAANKTRNSKPSSSDTARSRPRIHYVRDGDSLESLAQRFLGSPERAGEIFEANRPALTSADLLPVGTRIVIPPRERDATWLTGPAAVER